MKKIVFLIILIGMGYATGIYAGNSQGFHGLRDSLFEMGFSAANMSLAQANGAGFGNSQGGLLNPAGLVGVQKGQIHFLQNSLSNGIDLFSADIAVPVLDDFILQVSWVQIQTYEIPLISQETASLNEDLEAEKLTSAVEHGLVSALAYPISKDLSIGLSLNLFQYRFSALSDQGYGVSLTPGMCYRVFEDLNFGAYVDHFMSYQRWSTGHTEQQDPLLHLGFRYQLDQLTLFSDTSKGLKTPLVFKYAMEYAFFQFIKLRLGLYPDGVLGSIQHINAGIGFNLGNLSLDYTYLGKSVVYEGDASRITVGVGF